MLPDAGALTSATLLPAPEGGEEAAEPKSRPTPRLASLDIVRGFTVAVMILVDDAGGSWQTIDHAPWDGLTLADIVMPWFLFMVGTAMALSLKKIEASGRGKILKKLVVRSFKLFLLGLVLQGGGLPDASSGIWGWDLSTIRWCGILQRIAFAYFVVGITKTYVPTRPPSSAPPAIVDLIRMHALQWLVPVLFAIIYVVLMLSTPVPSWHVANSAMAREHGISHAVVACNGTRGDLGPACNAAALYDRLLFGQAHLYQPGEKVRLPECSACSPGYCPPVNVSQPVWCWAPFDPEGGLASFMTITTTYACRSPCRRARCPWAPSLRVRPPSRVQVHWRALWPRHPSRQRARRCGAGAGAAPDVEHDRRILHGRRPGARACLPSQQAAVDALVCASQCRDDRRRACARLLVVRCAPTQGSTHAPEAIPVDGHECSLRVCLRARASLRSVRTQRQQSIHARARALPRRGSHAPTPPISRMRVRVCLCRRRVTCSKRCSTPCT